MLFDELAGAFGKSLVLFGAGNLGPQNSDRFGKLGIESCGCWERLAREATKIMVNIDQAKIASAKARRRYGLQTARRHVAVPFTATIT